MYLIYNFNFVIGPLFVHVTAFMTLMFLSAYYHNFWPESECQSNKLRKLDLMGICAMICGSTTAPFYYGFMCSASSFWGNVYLSQVWLFCFVALFMTMRNSSESASAKALNAFSYIVAGYSTVPGIYHLAYSMQQGQISTTF